MSGTPWLARGPACYGPLRPQSDSLCAWSPCAANGKHRDAHGPGPGEPPAEDNPGTKCQRQRPCSFPWSTTAPGWPRKGRQEAKSRTTPRGQQRPVLTRARAEASPPGQSAPPHPSQAAPLTDEVSSPTGKRPASRRPLLRGLLRGASRRPGTEGRWYLVISSIHCHNVFGRWSAVSYTCTVSQPSVGHLAHKIDLGEIIQFHFTFSCLGTLPAATPVLPEVRKLWTRQSPAVVNGAPYSRYEFPVNLQITSNTIALHSDSVLCLHACLLPLSDYGLVCRQLSLRAPPGASAGSVGGRGQEGPRSPGREQAGQPPRW